MGSRLALKAAAVWFGLLVLAVANGFLREFVLAPALGPPADVVASGLLLAAAVVAVAWATLPWLAPSTRGQRWAIGAGWAVAVVAFEFALGVAQGRTLAAMLAPYTFDGGNLWPLVLATTAAAPALADAISRARRRPERRRGAATPTAPGGR